VWQQGANKKVEQAHLDITHFQSLNFAQVQAIEFEANKIVRSGRTINKGYMPKDEAEKQYGFSLYQGGVVPGNTLRVVNIVDTDTEACCGTHASNTAQVGLIKIFRAIRISDGIVRLYFVAGDRALTLLSEDATIINTLSRAWDVPKDKLVSSGEGFFASHKEYEKVDPEQKLKILHLQMRVVMLDAKLTNVLATSTDSSPTLFIGNMPSYAQVTARALRIHTVRDLQPTATWSA
jgi:alanyl-tRNA synthetase